jgi:hypothetical protein
MLGVWAAGCRRVGLREPSAQSVVDLVGTRARLFLCDAIDRLHHVVGQSDRDKSSAAFHNTV